MENKTIDEIFHDESWSPEQQMQEMCRRTGFYQEGENRSNLSFVPKPDDVIVAVAPKSGTTWMLHICHQIRMHGVEPDFERQTDVLTWIELAEKMIGIDLDTMVQPANPRIFATHLQYPLVPKGGRIVYCFREQKDVLVSAYYFLDSFLSLKGRISLQCFAQYIMAWVEQNLKDLLNWWEHRHDDDVLLIFYDDIKEDHMGSVRRIAKFIGVDCDGETLARVVHTTTHAEMARNHTKFSTHLGAAMIASKAGDTTLPEGESVGRVRRNGGKSGDGNKLPVEIQQRIDQLWQEIIIPKLGFQNLNAMREAWHKDCNH